MEYPDDSSYYMSSGSDDRSGGGRGGNDGDIQLHCNLRTAAHCEFCRTTYDSAKAQEHKESREHRIAVDHDRWLRRLAAPGNPSQGSSAPRASARSQTPSQPPQRGVSTPPPAYSRDTPPSHQTVRFPVAQMPAPQASPAQAGLYVLPIMVFPRQQPAVQHRTCPTCTSHHPYSACPFLQLRR
ncbi:hypothetical protein EXIGLDRAFT_113401 [Exidia glandulosa HHB12029]|uniref:Uncharacterized protein n=1 Tax=Exidia glandulosa HHB12029 TaxID=1314781 RepID=A0A165GN03_EXIGL|nr:hypothetical protein EXIGLDRAFT_113401 [Exidia glandulosa HHB12029]